MNETYILYLPYLLTEAYLRQELEKIKFSPNLTIVISYNDGGLISKSVFESYSRDQRIGFYEDYLKANTAGTALQKDNPYYVFANRFQKVFVQRYDIIVKTILSYERSQKGRKIRYVIIPQGDV
jgi:hypothetical protein